MPTTKKKKKPTKTKKPAAPTFAFFGQGDASYFEWFEMWIWFAKPVAKPMQQKLVKIAPELCKMDAQWAAPNLLWASTGDQWIHQHIITEYGTKAQKAAMKRILAHQEETGDPWDTGDEDEEAAFAGAKELNQFNTDIETWLIAMNELQPILFAARREDGEAGGTKLGAWHRRSVASFQSVVRPAIELVTTSAKKKKDMRPSALEIAIHYGGAVSSALAKWAARESV
jgi:hypothetical protein